jgi:hypothetical protein
MLKTVHQETFTTFAEFSNDDVNANTPRTCRVSSKLKKLYATLLRLSEIATV